MPGFGWLSSVWKTLFRRGQLEADLGAELNAYIEMLTEEQIRAGVPPGKARREALLEAGGLEQLKEQVRDARNGSALDGIWQDLRHTLRSFQRSKSYTALAVLMLTLGIGATTLTFSVFYSVLLRPLPFRDPSRLVQVWETRLQKGWQRASFSEANFWDVRARSSSAFEDMAAFNLAHWNMTGDGQPEHVDVGLVSEAFFRTLGVEPVIGRDFPDHGSGPGPQNERVLLANRFWRTRFGSNPGVVGRTLRLDGKAYLVLGVLPPGEPWLNDAQIFVPLTPPKESNRGSFEISVIGRLKSGVSAQAAAASLQLVCRTLAQQFPKEDGGMGVTMASATSWSADDKLRSALWILLGAVTCLLLIACVNLANLLLAKSTSRMREMTVRAALGASRGRLVRLVLTESVLLSLVGGGLGLWLADAGIRASRALDLSAIPRLGEANLNGAVLGFTLLVACLSGILAGLLPALQVNRQDLTSALRDGDRTQTAGRQQIRSRSLLTTAEVALSLMLLIGAGLLVRSFGRLLDVKRGFDVTNRLLFTVNFPTAYPGERVDALVSELLRGVEEIPGVVNAAAVNTRPITGWDPGMGIDAADKPAANAGSIPWASWRLISSGYFKSMGIPLLAGRSFTEKETFGRPGRVVITRALAESLWPGQNAIGRKVLLWKGQSNHLAEVIGVAGDIQERGLDVRATPLVFMPSNGSGFSPVDIVVHTASDPLRLVPALRARLASLDPGLPLANVGTLDNLVDSSLTAKRLNVVLISTFSGVALLLALAGIYGVVSYSVARRTGEIGLRVVLGASRASIIRLIVLGGMRPVFMGIVLGIGAALALSRVLVSLLFGVEPVDPATYLAMAFLVGATAALSCLLPALRGARTDPAEALRQN